MYLLDTGHFTILERGGSTCEKLRARLLQVNSDEVSTTIISCEEQTRGWLARIAKVEIEAQVQIYRKQELNLSLFSGLKKYRLKTGQDEMSTILHNFLNRFS